MIILTDEPLDPVAVTDSVRQDGNGAVVTFPRRYPRQLRRQARHPAGVRSL